MQDLSTYQGSECLNHPVSAFLHTMNSEAWRETLKDALNAIADEEFDGSGAALARAVGVRQSTMSRYLRGKTKSVTSYEKAVAELRRKDYPIDAYIDRVEDSAVVSTRERLKRRVEAACEDYFDGNGSEMARRLGLDQSTISRALNGSYATSGPYERIMQSLHDEGYETASLDDTEEMGLVADEGGSISNRLIRSFQRTHEVTYYDVSAHAGDNGEIPLQERGATVQMQSFLLRQILGTIPSDVGMFRLEGESMQPEVRDGAIVFFRPADHVPDAGRYVIALDGEVLLKKVQRRAGGIYRISSANPDYAPEDIQQQGDTWVSMDSGATVNFRVIGKFLRSIHPADFDDTSTQKVLRALKRAGIVNR
jgi:phage repressor protein C with HTH and peptisase S24 domain